MLNSFKKIFLFVLVLSLTLTNFIFSKELKANESLPLFDQFPTLQTQLPYIPFANLPTPITKLNNLSVKLNTSCNIFVKDDGLTEDPFGGSKPRKNGFTCAQAKAQQANAILAMGPAGSNYVVSVAQDAKQLGIKCIALLTPQRPTAYTIRNLLLMKYFDAEIHYYKNWAERNEAVREYQKSCQNYYMPLGGSNEIGCAGSVNAALELKKQIDDKILPKPDYIYIGFATMGFIAGLMLGLKVAGLDEVKVIGVRAIPQSYEIETAEDIARIHNLTAQYLNKLDPSFPKFEIKPTDVLVNNNFFGEGYAHITPQVHNAIKLLNETEKIKLEGTYSGKAFAALIDDVQNKKLENKTVLFWKTNTSGDLSEITSQVDPKTLPEKLYRDYFETELQPLDLGC
ncbi:TPA: hypothetical protein DEO28_03325 [Candidatus Dependentiae bacterium]|nr:MAG: 1-aminocyclopropane-1-carboxylate deaminase [candidate division TM6 bacterium GW2011_GWE2_31_21]KKP53029.1 MAG: 1-aminocyclopropane-1-carboxylate deaminase [candidate division TM6 bacterium GW2011_GWF2_33_332]HBS48091.1 hypothetical protein [Candidatus Dependentiae bacterium]HBZ73514.1 hypothetical protein [Candidatus Dependentiae bacterium]